ncbi:hypothetical protein ACEPAI_4248 [Sanghuangporus weigelae]
MVTRHLLRVNQPVLVSFLSFPIYRQTFYNQEYPDTPSALLDVIIVFPNACFIVTAWFADGFPLYRCILVFRFELYILALPVLMYLSSIAMDVLLLFQTSRIFGRNAAMTVESSIFYAVFSLLFLGPYGAKSHVSNVLLRIVSQLQVIAPMLITFRVATRRAWDRSTATAPSTSMKFHTRAASSEDTESTAEAPDATEIHLPPDQTEGSNEKILTCDTEERSIEHCMIRR